MLLLVIDKLLLLLFLLFLLHLCSCSDGASEDALETVVLPAAAVAVVVRRQLLLPTDLLTKRWAALQLRGRPCRGRLLRRLRL